MKTERAILLNPGPVTTSKTVTQALLGGDLCHREASFAKLRRQITQGLTTIVGGDDTFTTVLFSGSGTAAVEACLNRLGSENKLLVVNNGAYGARIMAIAKSYDIPVVELAYPYHEPARAEDIAAQLQADPTIGAVAVVHHETTTGLLNPIAAIGDVLKNSNALYIVDAMSSYAGIPIDVDTMGIDFLAASANKCLQGIPGVSFVIAKIDSLMTLATHKARAYYLDLYQEYQAVETTQQMRFTPPVQVMYALAQAIAEYEAEGAHARYKRFADHFSYLAAGMRELGFSLWLPESCQSPILGTFLIPECYDDLEFDWLHDKLYEQGYTIYPAKHAIERAFRLAVIGDLKKEDFTGFLNACRTLLEPYRQHA